MHSTRRSWITLAVMLVLVALLGMWIALRPDGERGARARISTLAPSAVRELRVEWPDRRAVVLRKVDDAWRIVEPHTARAEPNQVERLLSLLEATTDLVLPAADLSRFGLDGRRASLSIDGQSFAFGATNPVTGSVYVLAGDKVVLVEPRYAGVIPGDPDSLNERRILAASEAPVGFVFPQFSVVQRDGRWQVTPADGDLGQDELLRWVEGWRLASALRAEPFEGRAPASHIAVHMRDGRRAVIGVSEHEGEIAFTRYDERMRYYFFANNAKRLLAPPRAALDEKPLK